MQLLVRWGTVEDAPFAVDIWREAARWLIEKQCPLWSAEEFDLVSAQGHARARQLALGFNQHTPCACMLVGSADLMVWPEKENRSALYLHKIAVRRAYAGHGWPKNMISWAAARAKTLGVPLRLDCDPRPALMILYESLGFSRVDPGPVQRNGFTVMRYELS